MNKDFLRTPRGTRDLVGYEAKLHEYLISKFAETAVIHGFEPIKTPIIEYFKLFEAKSGEEIKKSMYVFADKAGRQLALRPEITASIIRAYLKHLQGGPKPVKLYYVGPCYRYEEPQRGRYREFWQAGLEIIGDDTIYADLDAALTASSFLEELGVKHYYLVGNVAVYRTFMNRFGISQEEQDHILHLIDKKEYEKLEAYLTNKNPKLLELLNELKKLTLDKLRSYILDYKGFLGNMYDQVLREVDKLTVFIEYLNDLGYNAIYDPTLVRGLAYYTGLIYEYKSYSSIETSIGGGGRYDGLTTIYGGGYEHSTGLALGLDRIMIILEERSFPVPKKPAVVIAILTDTKKAYMTGALLRKRINSLGISSWIIVGKKIKKILRYANKKNATFLLIIGPKELEESRITVKNLLTGSQSTLNIQNIERFLVEDILTTDKK